MWPKHLSKLPDKCLGCSSYDRLCATCTEDFLNWFRYAIEEEQNYWAEKGPYVIADTFEERATIRDGRLPIEWTQKFTSVPAKHANVILAEMNRAFYSYGNQMGG